MYHIFQCNSAKIKQTLEIAISNSFKQNTGFLVWTDSCCFASINQESSKDKDLFSVVSFSSDSFVKHTKHINGLDALVDMITNSLNINIQLIETLKFNIQFIKCSSKLTESERKCLMRKHRRKHYYDTMEPLAKKKFLQDNQQRYSKMNTKKKKEKVSKQKEKQQSLNSIKKAVLKLRGETITNLSI